MEKLCMYHYGPYLKRQTVICGYNRRVVYVVFVIVLITIALRLITRRASTHTLLDASTLHSLGFLHDIYLLLKTSLFLLRAPWSGFRLGMSVCASLVFHNWRCVLALAPLL
jgi:hypothetical protein